MDDERSAVAIRQIIQRWREKTDTEPGWRDWLADEAEAAIATLLKRIEEREAQIAVKDDALRYYIRYHNDGIGQLTHAIAHAESAITPDTGKRVVDVEWLRQAYDVLANVGQLPQEAYGQVLSQLTSLIGEGE